MMKESKMGHDNHAMSNSSVSLSMPQEPRGSYRGSNEFIRKYTFIAHIYSNIVIHFLWKKKSFNCQFLIHKTELCKTNESSFFFHSLEECTRKLRFSFFTFLFTLLCASGFLFTSCFHSLKMKCDFNF